MWKIQDIPVPKKFYLIFFFLNLRFSKEGLPARVFLSDSRAATKVFSGPLLFSLGDD